MIAGLPRSGSTLLSSILEQNPRFSAGISNPLNEAIHGAINAFSVNGSITQMHQEQRINVISSMIEGYHKHCPPSIEVAFNTSRNWPAYLSVMHLARPEAKVICCVRDIFWVLDSFELLREKDPTIKPHNGDGTDSFQRNTVYTRAAFNFNQGPVAVAFNCLKQGYYSEHTNKLYFVEYEDLAKNPERTLRGIYDFIGEPYYSHDFDNVEKRYDEYDLGVAQKDLHYVRKKVEYVKRPSTLPPDLFEEYTNKGYEFWRN